MIRIRKLFGCGNAVQGQLGGSWLRRHKIFRIFHLFMVGILIRENENMKRKVSEITEWFLEFCEFMASKFNVLKTVSKHLRII